MGRREEQRGGWRRNHRREEPARDPGPSPVQGTCGFASTREQLCHGERGRTRPAAEFAFTRGTCPGGGWPRLLVLGRLLGEHQGTGARSSLRTRPCPPSLGMPAVLEP